MKNIKIIDSKDGHKSLILLKDKKSFYVNSRYKPVEEAKKWVMSLNIKNNSVIVIFGLGLRHRIKEIMKKMTKENQLIIIEPCDEIFNEAKKHFKFSDIELNSNIHIIAGKNQEKYKNILWNYIDWTNVKDVIINMLPNYDKVFESEYKKFVNTMQDIMHSRNANYDTVNYFAKIWTENQFENIPYMLQSSYVNDLFGVFKNKPAVIVSAGPSLNKNVKLLKEAKEKCVIICIGTALKVLLKENIKPDIVVTIDGGKSNYMHFKDLSYDDIPLIYAPRTNFEILKNHKGKKILSISFDAYIENLFIRFGKKIGFLKSGGSVANTAFDLAIKLGANPVIFVGQDLAFTNGRAYAEGTRYETKNINDKNYKDKYLLIEGIDGNKVYTTNSWYNFLIWFGNEIEKDNSDRLYIDATEGGAKIKGTKILRLQDCIDKYCKDYIGITEKLKYVLDKKNVFNSNELELLYREYRNIEYEWKNIEENCKEAQKLCQQLYNIYSSDSDVKCNNVNLILSKLTNIGSCIKNSKDLFNLIEFIIEPILVNLSNNYDDETKKLQKELFFYKSIQEAISFSLPLLHTCIDEIGKMI